MMRTAPLALVATLLAPLTLSPVTAQAAEAGANTAASRYVSLVRTDQPGGMFGYWASTCTPIRRWAPASRCPPAPTCVWPGWACG